MWIVELPRKTLKKAAKMPSREQDTFRKLVKELQLNGPVQPDWPNYSKLSVAKFHCHLSYRWVACWEVLDNTVRIMEVYYVGSRENAPY